MSSRQAGELLDRADRVGAKVVLVGDRQQHRAVEAGSPFDLLINRGAIATERLDVIRRQKDARLRETIVATSETGGAGRAVREVPRWATLCASCVVAATSRPGSAPEVRTRPSLFISGESSQAGSV